MSKDTISVNMNIYDIPILVEQLEKANKEIQRLKEEYVMLQNAGDEVEEEKDEEIERLNNRVRELEKAVSRKEEQITDLDDENFDLENEIEKLNNIIKEFEDWLKEKKEQMERFELYKRKETGAFWYSTMGNIETFIDKIEELKGSDKE